MSEAAVLKRTNGLSVAGSLRNTESISNNKDNISENTNSISENTENISEGSENKKKERKHVILGKPYLQLVLLPLFLFLTCQIVQGFLGALLINFGVGSVLADTIAAIVAACGVLLVHKLWFRGEVPVSIGTNNLGKGLLLGLPFFAAIACNLVGCHVTPVSIVNALLMGLVPGLIEELTFRSVSIANAMKYTKGGRAIIIIAIISAIMFGGIHLVNLTAGQDLATTLCQVCYACGIGVFFAALYLRTGSILTPIILHTLFDAAGSADVVQQQAGEIMASGGFNWFGILLAVACIGYGIFLIRKSKWGEIRQLWDDKFAAAAK